MTDQLQPLKSFQAFYFNTPLYEKLQINTEQINQYLMKPFTFDGYCPYCRRMSTFHRSAGAQLTGYNDAYFLQLSQMKTDHLTCARQSSHTIYFNCYLDASTLQKVGQFPSFADIAIDESKEYTKLLSKEDASEFHKAIGLAAHGVGIGSFVYLRRIFERLIHMRFEEFKDAEGWDGENYKKLRMSDRIQLLRNHLPEFLVRNKAIYSIMSVGVHELDEKECLAFFPVLRTSTIVILEEDKKKKEELQRQAELEKAIATFEHPKAERADAPKKSPKSTQSTPEGSG